MKNGMLIIEDISLVWVDEEKTRYELTRSGQRRSMKVEGPDGTKKRLKVSTEMVHGKTYSNSRGEKVCIGMTGDAVKALGWPVDNIERLETEGLRMLQINSGLRRQLAEIGGKAQRLESQVQRFESMTIWQRIKFLFGG